MAFVVEDGTGLPNSNALISPAFYREYHTSRGRTISGSVTDVQIQGWVVRATDYITKRFGTRFAGSRTLTSQSLPFPRTGVTIDGSEPAMILLLSSVVLSGGTGYVVGDIVSVSGGTPTTAARVRVDAVNTGVVTAVSVFDPGVYTAPSVSTATTGGTGSGLTLTNVFGGPLGIAQATAEYAMIAAGVEELAPTPPLAFDRKDSAGEVISGAGPVTGKREKVDVIEEETYYAGPQELSSGAKGSSTVSGWVIPTYPTADLLIEPFLLAGGASRTIRN
jgi:hypothetical protein